MFRKQTSWIMLLQVPIAWEWLSAGWQKINEGGFGAKFAESLPRTLGFFEKKTTATGSSITNPNTWYVNSFLAWGKANPTLVGYLVEFGEFITGLIIFAAIGYFFVMKKTLPTWLVWVVVVGLTGGIFLNLNFYFAAAWPETGISTLSLNVMMLFLQAIFVAYYLIRPKEEK